MCRQCRAGAGRGVNDRWRHACCECSSRDGFGSRTCGTPSPEQVSYLPEGQGPLPGTRQAWWLGWWWGKGLSGLCQEGQAQPVSETDTSQSDPESWNCKGVQEELVVWWG